MGLVADVSSRRFAKRYSAADGADRADLSILDQHRYPADAGIEMLTKTVLRNVLETGCQQRAAELLQNTMSRIVDLDGCVQLSNMHVKRARF